ncbi:MAG: hypothetical protein KUG65_02520, partial [Sphingomonadaceae bacterium]|nr:hypothetical protein [Sphingomonadaceae bacterium]
PLPVFRRGYRQNTVVFRGQRPGKQKLTRNRKRLFAPVGLQRPIYQVNLGKASEVWRHKICKLCPPSRLTVELQASRGYPRQDQEQDP